ncbi:MAG TPA: hypothetical protein VEJ20_09065 [Candidatus Eremiobacteraceae bacterium]|nr:hypothetical protein [Candidatus Eremiobacteraceae bacterium]
MTWTHVALITIGVSAVVTIVPGVWAAIAAARLKRRISSLSRHPAVASLREIDAAVARLRVSVERLRGGVARTGEASGRLFNAAVASSQVAADAVTLAHATQELLTSLFGAA